ncbi:bifunctional DedA family/phosphatase PAP2 family protein [Amphritea sp. HPY]|uniref:bifunctional DedA family/phosphatase PAP2 family protein n=1 Tax=Amphritea sp. HPY TaxID=3421652 RepID=UPI003D7E7447
METLLQPEWLLASIGLIAFIESLAFAGIIVPGVALLFAAAAAAGQNQITVWFVLMSAYIGAISGDLISFWLGRHAAPYVRSHWPFSRYPHWLERGELLFRKYGGYSVVIGRFIGPIRPVIPFVAGTLGMKRSLFIAFNLLSALAWAPVYILPGYFLGSSSEAIDPQWLPLLYLLAAVIILLLLIHKLHQWLQPERILATKLQLWLRLHHFWPENKTIPTAAITLLLISSLLCIALISIQLSGAVQDWNSAVQQQIYSLLHGQPSLILTTLLGDKTILLPLILTSAGYLALSNQKNLALAFTGITFTAIIVNSALKLAIQFPRPETGQWLSTFSFPSGHTSAAAATLFCLAVLIAAPLQPAIRRWCYLIICLPVLAVALSRVALGVHWPLDVITAVIEGTVFAATLRILSQRFDWQKLQTKKTSATLAAIWLLGCTGYLALQFSSALADYS